MMGNRPSRSGYDEEVVRKNRRIFDSKLKRCGSKIVGKGIFLNTEGMSYISYGRFVIIVEVPLAPVGCFYIYTLVCRLSPSDNATYVLQRAMELNFMEFGTRGSTLGLQNDEINLCYSGSIAGLTAKKLQDSIETFIRTAVEVNAYLESAKPFHLHHVR